LTSVNGFAASDYLLFGEFGSETSEIVQVNTITTATNTVVLLTPTKFAHAESTRVTIIRYNQVKFYYTATATFTTDTILSTVNVEADSNFTTYQDTSNTTGFGWFVFYNSTTVTATSNSNAIPYAGFDENSVKVVLDSFYSILNNKESKLISNTDAMRWMNEALAIAVTELNMVNKDISVSSATDVTTVSGTAEYALSSNFSKIISVWDDTNGAYINNIDYAGIDQYDDDGSSANVRYYVRYNGGTFYIGFTPIPGDSVVYKVRFRSKSTRLTSLYDNINLPDNNFYCLVDYMMYRAAPKLKSSDGESFLKAFYEGIKRLKLGSHKLDGDLDSWGISDQANI
jgi:hypothetical protein